MTDEEIKIVERGRAAQDLLDSAAFQAVHDIVERRYLNDMMTSRLDSVEVRESAFRKLFAHREYLMELQSWVAAKESVEYHQEGEDLFN